MAENIAAALSAEMRRALKQEIHTLSDAAMADFRQNDRAHYDDFMDLVNDLLTFENEHGIKIYDDAFDEHFAVTANNSARETIYDIQYNGRPISTMFDSMKEASADALVKTVRRARFTPTATTFSFDNPVELEHRPEAEYRDNGVFSRDPKWRRFYKPGRWASDWENAPTPEPTPNNSPISSAETTPRTKEFMAMIDTRWDIATANARKNRRQGVTRLMDDYDETSLRYRDDVEHTAAKKARRDMKEKSKTFFDFIDSLPDPAGEEDDKDDFESNDLSAQTWSFHAMNDDSTHISEEMEQKSSQASIRISETSRDDGDNCKLSPERYRPNVSQPRKDFLDLQDDLADGMDTLHIEEDSRAETVHANVKLVNAPRRTLRRVTAKIQPR